MQVPFVDLKTQYQSLKEKIIPGITQVLQDASFILGPQVDEFEKAFAQYCQVNYSVGVANGTDAIHMAMRALDIGRGDEVIVPAHTFIATVLGVTYSGARPVLVDCDDKTFLMDVSKIEAAVGPKTKAILPVHLYGRMMDCSQLIDLKEKHNLFLVEDAAQAHGAELNGQRAGSLGDLACFSFYPGKNLGAYGDGGACTTQSKDHASKLRSFRNYGSQQKYFHPTYGFNSRLDSIQAVVLHEKLKYLDQYNRARYQVAQKYDEALGGIGDLVLPEIPQKGSHVFHLYVIRTKKRNGLLKHLQENGIGCGIHYPTPIHLHGAYSSLGYKKGDFPVAENICDEILSLPCFPELNDDQVNYVTDVIKKFF